jgi:cell division protein FtsW
MAKLVGVDKWLFFTTLVLVVVGLVMVFSASAIVAQERYHSPYAFVGRQAGWALAGMLLMLILMHVDYTVYNSPRFIYPALAVTTLLLAMVFFFPSSHNTHRWIRFGGFFTFQPSEIAKPAVVLFLAWFLHTRLDAMRDWKHTLLRAAIIPAAFILLVVKQPDLGTAMVLAGVTGMMLVLAGMEWKYLIGAACAVLPFLAALLYFVSWRWIRVLAFLHPEADPQGAGFHINQSLIAVGTGGLTGRGYMEACRSSSICPRLPRTLSLPTLPRSWDSLGASRLCCFLRCWALADYVPPFAPRIPLPAWLHSALQRPSCCRLFSTSA